MWKVEEVQTMFGTRYLIRRGDEVLSITNGGSVNAIHFDDREDAQDLVDILEACRMARSVH